MPILALELTSVQGTTQVVYLVNIFHSIYSTLTSEMTYQNPWGLLALLSLATLHRLKFGDPQGRVTITLFHLTDFQFL